MLYTYAHKYDAHAMLARIVQCNTKGVTVPITQIKPVYPPQGFWGVYPSSISVLLDLINVPFTILLVRS